MNQLHSSSPWTNVYGLARTLLATGTLMTLLLNSANELFMPLGRSLHSLMGRVAPAKYSLFLLFEPQHLEVARWLAIAGLVVVASGWRPRVTALLHWWISASLASAAVILDGGDQVTVVLTFLLLPIALTDNRRWHWSAPSTSVSPGHRQVLATLVAASALAVLRLQVAAIYLNAGIAKMSAPEWNNGTAMYYWINSPLFGADAWLQPLLSPVVRNGTAVTLLTWAVMLFEVTLGAALVMRRRWWQPLLVAGLLFHLGISLLHGLVSFMFAMDAALILFLRPWQRPFDFGRLLAPLTGARRRLAHPAGANPALTPR